jgi:hypothetical protein
LPRFDPRTVVPLGDFHTSVPSKIETQSSDIPASSNETAKVSRNRWLWPFEILAARFPISRQHVIRRGKSGYSQRDHHGLLLSL